MNAVTTGGKSRVLIVDDDLDSRSALNNIFKVLGHEATVVGTAAEALELIRTRKFDAVLLDLVLPDDSGAVVLEQAREMNLPVKIAVVSGLAGGPMTEMDRFRPDAVFQKPIDAFELAAWVGTCAPALQSPESPLIR